MPLTIKKEVMNNVATPVNKYMFTTALVTCEGLVGAAYSQHSAVKGP